MPAVFDHWKSPTSKASSKAPLHAVVLAHPDADSFNSATAQAYCEAVRGLGHEVVLRDLYRLGFDPVLKSSEQPRPDRYAMATDVAAELAAIEKADVFVLVYPVWFGAPPAILKGYVDRVLGAGFSSTARSVSARGTVS